MEPPNKTWFVEIDETVYEATAETIDQWIWDGTVLSQHRVSRGGERWLEAGKAPQFAKHFHTTADVIASEGIGLKTAPVFRAPADPAVPYGVANPHPPFGVRLMAGSMIALFVALLAGYLWAYQVSKPKDLAEINSSPGMHVLQDQYDADKAVLEKERDAAEAARKAAAGREAGGLSDRSFEFIDCDRTGPETSSACLELRKQPGRWLDNVQKTKASVPVVKGPTPVTALDRKFSDLDTKFEADKKQIITDARNADSRSKFYSSFGLLFLVLAGLNLTRLSLTSKK
jgi:hypothetical protein